MLEGADSVVWIWHQKGGLATTPWFQFFWCLFFCVSVFVFV
jgi:hypothetical protein